jgi:phytoene dehydrogenase-like protein
LAGVKAGAPFVMRVRARTAAAVPAHWHPMDENVTVLAGTVKIGMGEKYDAKAAPALAKYQAWRSVYSIVSKFVKNEHLRQALSFHTLLVGGNPMTCSSIYALIHKLERDGGVWFAMGGTNRLVAAMVALFERIGGTIRPDRGRQARAETGQGAQAQALLAVPVRAPPRVGGRLSRHPAPHDPVRAAL